MAIRSWADEVTRDIYHGIDSKRTRNRLPKQLHEPVRERLDVLDNTNDLFALTNVPGYRLEKLQGTERDSFR